jgi:hypothetical protein
VEAVDSVVLRNRKETVGHSSPVRVREPLSFTLFPSLSPLVSSLLNVRSPLQRERRQFRITPFLVSLSLSHSSHLPSSTHLPQPSSRRWLRWSTPSPPDLPPVVKPSTHPPQRLRTSQRHLERVRREEGESLESVGEQGDFVSSLSFHLYRGGPGY